MESVLTNAYARFFDHIAPPLLGCVFVCLVWLQRKYPLRRQRWGSLRRALRNFALGTPGFVVLRLLMLPVPLIAGDWAMRHDLGLLNRLHFPLLVNGVLGFLLLDYFLYLWHVALHRAPLLWRFHNVHHTDLDMDVTTAVRFHAGELLFSVVYRVTAVLIFGISPWTQVIFEVAFETATQFHHSNWRLPIGIERNLNRVIVTPRMHGVHHSIVQGESNSNWGTIFSWWDRRHGTLCLDVAQDEIVIGVPSYRDESELTLGHLFLLPFRRQRPWQLPNGEQPQRPPLETDQRAA